MATRQPKQEPMCVITIGLHDFAVPSKTGLRLVEMLQGAIEVTQHYEGDLIFVPRANQPKFELKIIQPLQIINRAQAPSRILELE